MDLQQKQLQQLSDWLSQTEERIMKIETEPPAKDMEVYQERIEQHKVNPPAHLASLAALTRTLNPNPDSTQSDSMQQRCSLGSGGV